MEDTKKAIAELWASDTALLAEVHAQPIRIAMDGNRTDCVSVREIYWMRP